MNRKGSWKEIESIKPLGGKSVHFFKIDSELLAANFKQELLVSALTPIELGRYHRFRFNKDKLSFALGRYLLKLIYEANFSQDSIQEPLSIGDHGKPYFKNSPNLRFSISHSATIVLVALSHDVEIGVDVEVYDVDINHKELAFSTFSSNEVSQLNGLSAEQEIDAFYRCWTKKESYIKALGKGLQIPLKEFSVRIFDEDDNSLIDVKWDAHDTSFWKCFNFYIKDGYQAACCSYRDFNEFEYFDVTRLVSATIKDTDDVLNEKLTQL